MIEYLGLFMISLGVLLTTILLGWVGANFAEACWRAWQRRKIRKAYGRYGDLPVELHEFYAKKKMEEYRKNKC